MRNKRDGQLGTVGLTIKTLISNFKLSGSQSSKRGSNVKEKDIYITLDHPAFQRT